MEVENDSARQQSAQLGQLLKTTREKKGLLIEQVADKLKLKVSTVAALERDDYRDLGGVVYVKGYLRSYGRLLDLNLESYLQPLQEDVSHLNPSYDRSTKPKKASIWLISEQFGLWCCIIVLLGAAIAAFFWHYDHSKKLVTESNDGMAVVHDVPSVSGTGSQTLVLPAKELGKSADNKPATPALTTEVAQASAPASVSAPVAAPSSEPAASPTVVPPANLTSASPVQEAKTTPPAVDNSFTFSGQGQSHEDKNTPKVSENSITPADTDANAQQTTDE